MEVLRGKRNHRASNWTCLVKDRGRKSSRRTDMEGKGRDSSVSKRIATAPAGERGCPSKGETVPLQREKTPGQEKGGREGESRATSMSASSSCWVQGRNALRLVRGLYMTRCPHSRHRMGSPILIGFSAAQSESKVKQSEMAAGVADGQQRRRKTHQRRGSFASRRRRGGSPSGRSFAGRRCSSGRSAGTWLVGECGAEAVRLGVRR